MADKYTLDLAREWAADIDADRQTLSQDTIDAAADLISSLPDSWVDADTLRKYISDWREGLAKAPRGNYEAEMLDDLEDMLPAPPAPSRPMFPGGRVWYIEGPVGDVRATSDGKVVAFGTWQERPFRIVSTPEGMRTLARTLEAAADHAQKEETNE